MASAEDIYRKIRRGETAGLKFSRPSDEELVDGVERIRSRLSKNLPEVTKRPALSQRNWLIWVAPVTLAAIALVAFFLLPKNGSAPASPAFAAGTTHVFGSVEIRVLTTSEMKHEFSGAALSLNLMQGAVAVKRKSDATALIISTPDGILEAQGTAFILEHDRQTSVELAEGRLAWRREKQVRLIDERHPRLGRDLSALRSLLPAGYMDFPPAAHIPARSTNALAGPFRPKACVIYTVNGIRRQGIIREVMHGKYRLAHEGIDEPDLFSSGDLISCGDARKP